MGNKEFISAYFGSRENNDFIINYGIGVFG